MGGIRVLHVSQPVRGGVAAVVAQYAAAQVEAGWQVTVACPAAHAEDLESGALAHSARQAGAAVAHWAARRAPGRTVPAEARELARLLRELRPELIHLHSSKAGLAGRLAARGRFPVLFQPHAWSFEAVSGPVAAASLRWERYAARWSARIVCVSEGERAAGQRAGIRGRYVVIPNGVETRRFQPAATREPGSDGGPVVAVVGRLCRQKGQDLLLDAWPTIAARQRGTTAAGYTGLLDLDLRWDPRARDFALLDFNPRLGAQFRLFADAAGLDLPRAAHLDLTGRPVPEARPRPGRRFVVETYDPLGAAPTAVARDKVDQ